MRPGLDRCKLINPRISNIIIDEKKFNPIKNKILIGLDGWLGRNPQMRKINLDKK